MSHFLFSLPDTFDFLLLCKTLEDFHSIIRFGGMTEPREPTFQKGFYHSMGLIKSGPGWVIAWNRPAHQRFAKVAMSPRPSSFRSAVTKVSANTLAVAAKNRSAGSA
jgi:hypothetical protein